MVGSRMNLYRMQGTQKERGQVTAEFIVVIPMLLFLFFLMVDFGWLMKNWLVVTNASRESARCAIASSCQLEGTPVAPDVLALDRMTDGGVSDQTNLAGPPDIDVHYIDHDSNGLDIGDSLIVCIQAENEYITPVLPFLSLITQGAGSGALPNPFPLSSREEMLIEFVDPDGPLPGLSSGGAACNFGT